MIFLHSVIMITFIECKHDKLTARSVITLLSVSMISLVRKKHIKSIGADKMSSFNIGRYHYECYMYNVLRQLRN